jgi:hypothetical protein
MSCTVTGGEPEVAVSAWTIGDAVEVLTLVAELIETSPGGAVRAEMEALMDRKGADPVPAADWMTASVRALAQELDDVLAFEGIACDRRLAQYWRRSGTRRQEG